MAIVVKPSDLYYKYPRDVPNRDQPKFTGKPDPRPFNRDDLYEVLPMLGAVMDELGRDDARSLHIIEELMIRDLPRWLTSRDDVFDFLVGCGGEALAD
jgi:hypothetical protein